MRAIRFNPFLEGLSGTFGDAVFRRVGDRVFLMHRPDLRGVRRTPAQLASQERFRQATRYAQAALADPALGEFYRRAVSRPGQRASAIAVRDFMVPPQVDRLDLSAYAGRPGDPIRLWAHDDLAVVSVSVHLADAANREFEAAPAQEDPRGGWIYLTRTALPPGTLVRVTAVALDRPGHQGELTLAKTVGGPAAFRVPVPGR